MRRSKSFDHHHGRLAPGLLLTILDLRSSLIGEEAVVALRLAAVARGGTFAAKVHSRHHAPALSMIRRLNECP